MFITVRASLIGKSEVRHQGGGFILTFQGETKMGRQQIQTWIPTEEGDKFPFGPKLDADGIPLKEDPKAPGEHVHPVQEYSIIVTDMDLASDEPTLALQGQIDELEEQNSTLEDTLSERDTDLRNLIEELHAAKDAEVAAKEQLVNLHGQVETLTEQAVAKDQQIAELGEKLQSAEQSAAAAAASSDPTK